MHACLKILHLEDLPSDAELVDRILRKSTLVFEKQVVDNKESFIKALQTFAPDIVLSDHSLPSFDSKEAISIVKKMELRIPIILVTATVSEEYAVEVMKQGACDYILKDRLQRLPNAVISAMAKHNLEKLAEEERDRHHLMEQKLITETSVRVQEKEREEIGTELHDNINQILASSKMYLETASSEISPSNELVHKAIETLTLAMKEIRQLSHRLVAPALESVSLSQAINNLVENSKGASAIQLHFDGRFNEEALTNDLKLMLYRVVQEQYNNIVKHSHAKNAFILIHSNAGEVMLTINDDGRGFDRSQVVSGIGIRNITNRAKLYGGTVSLQSLPGKGCLLTVAIPLSQD